MRQPAASRPTRSWLRPSTVNLAIVAVTIIVALVYQSSSSSASSFGEADAPGAVRSLPPSAASVAPPLVPRRIGGSATGGQAGISEADGALPDGVTVFDEAYSGVDGLDPDLLRALRDAATDAAEDGIVVYVNSGWRSPAYQDELHREAVARYGSEREALRWVATSDTSAHVSGDAVDVGPIGATDWLSAHGARYGLCQVYANEPWHFELRAAAPKRGCPPMYPDSAHDPNLQR